MREIRGMIKVAPRLADGARSAAARRAAVAAVCAAAVAGLPAAASAQVSRAPRAEASLTEIFNYSGEVAQTTVVPVGATIAHVWVLGGMGGGTSSAGKSVTGGDGALVSGRIAVSPGQLLTMRVAQRGHDGNGKVSPGDGGWGGTGRGGRGGSGYGYKDERDGAGGGGASSLEIGGETIVVAGGGGGGGGNGFDALFDPGGPGGSSGTTVDPGHNGKGSGGGKGGGGEANGQPAGGSGGSSTPSAIGGGGGGGGGGGRTGGGGGGGGGAGSSYYTSRLLEPTVKRGGGSIDGNGRIVITWNEVSAPECRDAVVAVPLDSPGVPFRLQCTGTRRPTSFVLLSHPQHGHLVDDNLTAGSFTYVPDPGYRGPDGMLWEARTGDAVSVPYVVTFIVGRPDAPLYLTASSTHVPLGQPPVLTVIMPSNATGYVGFYDENQPGADKGIGTAPIDDGIATLTMPTRELGVGAHVIHASYGGDLTWGPGDSNDVEITVSRP